MQPSPPKNPAALLDRNLVPAERRRSSGDAANRDSRCGPRHACARIWWLSACLLAFCGCTKAPLHNALTDLNAGRLESAREQLEAHCALNPDDGEARFMLARALVGLEEWAPALQTLAQAGGAGREAEFEILREGAINGAWNQAHAHWCNGDRAGATANWDWLCRVEPNDPEFLAWSGHGHLALGDTALALERYRAVGLQEDERVAARVMAILANTGDWPALLHASVRALERYPSSPALLRARATALDRLDRREQAVVAYEAAIAEEGPAVDLALALGRLLAELDDPIAAAEVLAKALPGEGESVDPELRLYLGECQFELGRFADARASFLRVLELDAENQAANDYLRLLEAVAEERDGTP